MAHWYLIHGAASSRLTWTKQMRQLPSVTRAALPELPGVNPSRLIESWAEWCLEKLTQPAVIMGHSLGGAIAQTMALLAPPLVTGLVLVGTGPRLPVNPRLIQSLSDDAPLALERITRWSLKEHPDPTILDQSLAQVKTVNGEQAYREFLACTYFDVRSRLKEITCPIAIIAGTEDRMTPEPLTREFLAIWPQAPYYTVEHAGHMMMLEQPEHFNQILGAIADRFDW